MYHAVFLIFMFFFTTLPSHASETNVGFVDGLWYSPEQVFAGTPTRIYVAFRNNTEHELTGTVRFSVDGTRVGSSDISALSGRLVEAWVDWTPTQGAHTVTATMSDAVLHKIGGDTERIDITGIVASSSLSVDYDTDGDGVGNGTDTDDDDDGVSDEDERARGTNPLVPNPVPKGDDTEEEKDLDLAQKIPQTKETENNTESAREGLEQYTDSGAVDSLLSSVTTKIAETKKSLDEYREERSTKLAEEKMETSATHSTSTSGTATITRTKIDGSNDFLASFVAGVHSLLSLVWTFILFLSSGALGHPAILELFLLLFIVYFVYRTARRLGRRPGY